MSTRVIIAGSRDFSDQDLFNTSVHNILKDIPTDSIQIISGGCRGADRMGEEYAIEWHIPYVIYPANWKKLGISAGPIRNEQMARYASQADRGILIAFPIGESRGTMNMIKLAAQYGLETHVIGGSNNAYKDG